MITAREPDRNSRKSASIPSLKITPFSGICDVSVSGWFVVTRPNTMPTCVVRLGNGVLSGKGPAYGRASEKSRRMMSSMGNSCTGRRWKSNPDHGPRLPRIAHFHTAHAMDHGHDLNLIANAYFTASLKRDLNAMTAALYPGDVDKFKTNLLWCAQAMDRFGETTSFLEAFGPDLEIEDLRVMSPRLFITKFFEGMMGSIPPAEWQDIASTFRPVVITRPSEDHAVLEYTYELAVDDEPEGLTLSREMSFQRIGGRWYVMLDANFRRMPDLVRHQVQDLQQRETKDRLGQTPDHSGSELEPFALWGYRNEAGAVVLEPRFGEAGRFCSGLAPVRFLRKWGYIAANGETIIKPRFDRACEFSEEMAAVAIRNASLDLVWGYIGPDGAMRIEPRFASAEPFDGGIAIVTMPDDHDEVRFSINAKGELVGGS